MKQDDPRIMEPHVYNRQELYLLLEKGLNNHILHFLKMRVLSLTQDLKVSIHPH